MATASASAVAARAIAGVEVPMLGSDRIRWAEVTVPSSSGSADHSPAPAQHRRDACGSHVVDSGGSKSYFVWWIHEDRPNALEVVELSGSSEPPCNGLRLIFKDELRPFSFICSEKVGVDGRRTCLLHALTISGTAFLCILYAPFSYISGSVLSPSDVVELDVNGLVTAGPITAVASKSGALVLGLQDGSVRCIQLGKLAQDTPGFSFELRDDIGIGRFWNIVSRGKAIGPVQDMAFAKVCQKELLFVLHLDGSLRLWDLKRRTKIFSHFIDINELQVSPAKLWVAEVNTDADFISLAILCRSHKAEYPDCVVVYNFTLNPGEKSLFYSEPSTYTIHLREEKLIDLSINTSNLWILKEVRSGSCQIVQYDHELKHPCAYILEETLVSEQLLQSTNSLEDLVWNIDSIASVPKEEIMRFISGIFLQNMILPKLNCHSTLRQTLLEYHKYFSDSEFQSLTAAGIKEEILTTMERELHSAAPNVYVAVHHWKKFCSHFYHHWCLKNMPCGLLLDSYSGGLSLIRKGSLSLFRCPEDIEHFIYGSPAEYVQMDCNRLNLTFGPIDLEYSAEIFQCMNLIRQQLGRCASGIYYQSFFCSIISYNDIVSQLSKIMYIGFSPSSASYLMSLLGRDFYLDKRKEVHRSQRQFSVDVLSCYKQLYMKASDWTTVFDAIENLLKYFNPCRNYPKCESKRICSLNSSLLVQATSQVARTMFQSAFDLMLFLSCLLNIGDQVSLSESDVARLKLKMLPAVQDLTVQWLVVNILGTFSTTSPTIEDFHYSLSSLRIGKSDELSLHPKLGSFEFMLAFLLGFPVSNGERHALDSPTFVNPITLLDLVRQYSSSIWGKNISEVPYNISSPLIDVVSVLLRNSQYEAAETLLSVSDTYISQRKASDSDQAIDDTFCSRVHLHGFCLLVLGYNQANVVLRDQRMNEAVRCFFRAASVLDAPRSLHKFSSETGFQFPGDCCSLALWRLNYYQWATQMFEQYHMSEGACQFAVAALEQVDAICSNERDESVDLPESVVTIRGRLWANVFKYKLDMKRYSDAYCAIVSNPDEESKIICLRRFVIVLCEHGAIKVLCDGEIPFIGLVEKVEQELFWKAERSDLSSRPNLYKVMYAFQACRSNWRRAASYMYRYAARLSEETSGTKSQIICILEEKMHALSAAINALQLVDKSSAWIEYPQEVDGQTSYKKPRNAASDSIGISFEFSRPQFCVDVEILEKEYLLTSAQYTLLSACDRYKVEGGQTALYIVDFLILEKSYEMAFTLILKFWKGSAMKSKLEQAFATMAQECCPSRMGSPQTHLKPSKLALPSADGNMWDSNTKRSPTVSQHKTSDHWENLELNLGKYIELHPRLPVIVAETLLYTDPQIELPLWLVRLFKTNKGGRRAVNLGMTGQEADPATLFRLYVDYGRRAEAANLLLEYLEALASVRPADVIRRKNMSAVWFPYTAIEKLWRQLDEMQNAGRDVDHCYKLKQMLGGALTGHLEKIVLDSEDVLSKVVATPNVEMVA